MTARQQRFIDEYIIDLNATQAAIRAGYSVNSAQVIGSENLTKPNIANAISRALAERSRRTGVTADRVIMELAKIAFVNISDVADFDSAAICDGASRDDTAAILSLKVRKIPTDNGCIIEREFRLCDKVKSLALLGRHLGIFDDKLSLDGVIEIVFSGENELLE